MVKGIDFPGVGVCFFPHDGKGLYLMQKRGAGCRDEQGAWGPAGGGLEHGETLQDAVAREMREEYGASARKIEYLGFREVHRTVDGKPSHWLMFDFRVLADPTEVIIGEPHMIDEIRWSTIEDLPQPFHSQMPLFLEKYKERFV